MCTRLSTGTSAMPSNGKRTSTRKLKTSVFPVQLSPEDTSQLAYRWNAWQKQLTRAREENILADIVQQEYSRCVRDIQGRYGLPPQYVVDFESGCVTPTAEEARDG